MNVYENCPEIQNERFLVRLIDKQDCDDLLKVYSDPKAVPLFNSDNCHGDDFCYRTPERMMQAIEFWIYSYNNGYFVRWSIIDRQTGEAVGTIELFQRESLDGEAATGLLRLDLRSDYEKADAIENLLGLITEPAYDWFNCTSITTKAAPQAAVRRAVLAKLGFVESKECLRGDNGTCYGHYFVSDKHA